MFKINTLRSLEKLGIFLNANCVGTLKLTQIAPKQGQVNPN